MSSKDKQLSAKEWIDEFEKFKLETIVESIIEISTIINIQGKATIFDLQQLASHCISFLLKAQSVPELTGDLDFLIELIEDVKVRQNKTLGTDELKSILSGKKEGEDPSQNRSATSQ
jgi:hypothetical protein